eukprot:COSAG02_NODE_4701_length_5079_cov_610.995382_1_plen_901_part_10
MQRQVSRAVVDPQLGTLYRRLANTRATRDWLAQEGLPTAGIDATIEHIQGQIRDVDATMKEPAASHRGRGAGGGGGGGPADSSPPIAAAPAADDDEVRLRQALEMSLLESVSANKKDILPVPPEWHRFVDKDLMGTIKAACTGLVAIESRMPDRSDLDGHIVLQGTPAAVLEAKRLLGPPIEKARKQQREDTPELLALLEMGYERANATRALVETCQLTREAVTHGRRVQQALDWLIDLHGLDADEDDETEAAHVPVPAPALVPIRVTQPQPEPESAPGVLAPTPVPTPVPEPMPAPEPELEPVSVPTPAPAPAQVELWPADPVVPVEYKIDLAGDRRLGLIVNRDATVQTFHAEMADHFGVQPSELRWELPDGTQLACTDNTELYKRGILPGTTLTVICLEPEPEPEPELEPEPDLDAPSPPIPPFPGVDDELDTGLEPMSPYSIPVRPPADEQPPRPSPTQVDDEPTIDRSANSASSSLGFSIISDVEAGIEPKLSCFRGPSDPGYKHAELTQGIIMWAVLTIIDRHRSQLRDIAIYRTDAKYLVCKGGQAQQDELSAEPCTDEDMQRLFPADFGFRFGESGGRPNPYRSTLEAVQAVQDAIETKRGSIGFRITIKTDGHDPRRLEQWAIILQGPASGEPLEHPLRRDQAIVAMRTLHAFSKLFCQQSSQQLQFEISRILPSAVSSPPAQRAATVDTSFGCVQVYLEYNADGSSVAVDATPPADHDQTEDVLEPVSDLGFQVENPKSWKDIDTVSTDVENGEIDGPGAMVGRYQVTKYLGQGQFGVVWKASVYDNRRDVNVDVAIKTIDRDKIRSARNKQFVQNEIKSMQSITHRNVVRLYEPLYSDTHILMVIEFCETDLKKYLHARGPRGLPSRAPLSEAEAKSFMRDFAAGMHELR